ncbi:molybdopterin converting factor subunit 1 [Galbibacter sp. EGI 63066]|uniref:molybdopterin converting factor subunit 1 n=1 Tax=Galbibacter sp. EGI 63066 TaxID=2993559 RepID=UPI0022498652|nr:molybdopterin converting factor subunit 1 [Galbibacter sp. EGI 63066]MCX2679935.1 molybdopterin converting factor subunit 1 [Galbibacter sp. EGI 63066]
MNILLFGIAREIVGGDSLKVESNNEIGNVKQLKSYLTNNYPKLNKLSSFAIAVNNKYAQEETAIGSSDEVALIPPVSGG